MKKIRLKDPNIIKCPRCGQKSYKTTERCPECDLIFSRLQFASNKAAKRQLLSFNKDFIINTNQLPSDVKRWKIMLYSILLGLIGGHYYYVGKYTKGILMTLGFAYLVVCTILNPILAGVMEQYLLYFPIGIYGIAWLISIVYVFTKKFKVPILIDMDKLEEDKNLKKAEFDRTKEELVEENKILKQEKDSKQKQNKKISKEKTKKETK